MSNFEIDRAEVTREAAALGVRAAARKHGIPRSTVGRWLRAAEAAPHPSHGHEPPRRTAFGDAAELWVALCEAERHETEAREAEGHARGEHFAARERTASARNAYASAAAKLPRGTA